MDSQLQNFWVESINKEASVRFNWHLKYSKRFATAASSATPKEVEGSKVVKLNSSLSKRMEKPISPLIQTRIRRGYNSIDAKAAYKSTPSVILHEMRPVSSKTRSLLYNGISAHGEGRYAYLTKRKSKSPVEKYEFPILSSCAYGWNIVDYGIPKTSVFARTSVIKDSFYRPSGIVIGYNNFY